MNLIDFCYASHLNALFPMSPNFDKIIECMQWLHCLQICIHLIES